MSITFALLILTGFVSYQALNNRSMLEKLMHHPYSEHRNKEYYRMLSSGFVHGSMNHLVINGFVLYMFGQIVERVFTQQLGSTMGPILFLVFYLSAIIVADLPSYFKHKNNMRYSAVGASGATSALVLVYCMLLPWEWLLFPPVPAIIFGVGYILYSSYADRTNKADGIGHSAHLYGALWGIVFVVVAMPSLLENFIARFLQGPSLPSWLPF